MAYAQPLAACSPAALRAEVVRALPDDARWHAPEAVTAVDETGSTNADLVALAQRARAERRPVPARALRVAQRQTAGRGRLARAWSTPADAGLAMSIGLHTLLAPAALSGFALVCGLAVHAALADFGVDARLKWPNDIVAPDARAKLGGILVEIVQIDAGQTWVVVGIGINLRAGAVLSAQLGRAITDLDALGARGVETPLLAARIVAQLETRFGAFERAGFAPFVDAFDRCHAFHDAEVAIARDAVALLRGRCIGVDARGEVMIRCADGHIERVLSGEVSLSAAEA